MVYKEKQNKENGFSHESSSEISHLRYNLYSTFPRERDDAFS